MPLANLPVRGLTALILLACGCGRAIPTPPEATFPMDPATIELVGELDVARAQSDELWGYLSWQSPPTELAAFRKLVARGTAALPTLMRLVATTSHDELRMLLLDAAARIDDPATLPWLERLAQAADSGLRDTALAVLPHRGAAARPFLRRLLAAIPGAQAEQRLDVLELLLRSGDTSALQDVLRIGLATRTTVDRAVEILLRHEPLRQAMGFAKPGDVFVGSDAELLLPAADEWYRETILREPSPYRPRTPEFSAPGTAGKQAGAAMLADCLKDVADLSTLRVQEVDPAITEADRARPVTVITGAGHSRGLAVWAWRPAGDRVHGHVFRFAAGPVRSTFPEDDDAAYYAEVSLPSPAYLDLVAGLRTILEADVRRWWAGPEDSWWSSYDFVASIDGIGLPDAAPRQFCGYHSAETLARCTAPLAAVRLHARTVRALDLTKAPPTDAGRTILTEVFHRHREHLTSDSYWFVTERMLTIARDCGGTDLLPQLVELIDARRANRSSSRRIAARAVTAIAAITGEDLRFTAAGAPRPIDEVAADYRRRFGR